MQKKIDIDKLLSLNDVNRSIIEIDNYICALPEGVKLTEPQQNFFYNQELEREINNCGFTQYFLNSSGDFAHRTIKSLAAIGAHKTAEILQAAINQFPGGTVPSNQEERQKIIEQIEDISSGIWNDLDQKFFNYEKNLNAINIEYVRQNKKLF